MQSRVLRYDRRPPVFNSLSPLIRRHTRLGTVIAAALRLGRKGVSQLRKVAEFELLVKILNHPDWISDQRLVRYRLESVSRQIGGGGGQFCLKAGTVGENRLADFIIG